MVIANGTGKHVFDAVAVVGAHPFLPHFAGSAAHAVTALGQL